MFDSPGDPSVLRVDQVADPGVPTANRIVVRVAASSINGTDLGLRRGAPGSAVFGRRVRLGFDVVGEPGASSEFSYRIVAKRLDAEVTRFERVPAPLRKPQDRSAFPEAPPRAGDDETGEAR